MKFRNFGWGQKYNFGIFDPKERNFSRLLTVGGVKIGVKRVKNLNLTPEKTPAGGVKNREVVKKYPHYIGGTF